MKKLQLYSSSLDSGSTLLDETIHLTICVLGYSSCSEKDIRFSVCHWMVRYTLNQLFVIMYTAELLPDLTVGGGAKWPPEGFC